MVNVEIDLAMVNKLVGKKKKTLRFLLVLFTFAADDWLLLSPLSLKSRSRRKQRLLCFSFYFFHPLFSPTESGSSAAVA